MTMILESGRELFISSDCLQRDAQQPRGCRTAQYILEIQRNDGRADRFQSLNSSTENSK
jgi:hypothetical protein